MATYFLDTSVLVKLYVEEVGSKEMIEIAGQPRARLAVASISRVEFRSALRRRQRSAEVDARTADAILARLDADLREAFHVQPIEATVLERALDVIDRHGVRAYDAVQLAACLTLRASFPSERTVFSCSDAQLLRAAQAEDLETLNPSPS